jgi:hypothetical protein
MMFKQIKISAILSLMFCHLIKKVIWFDERKFCISPTCLIAVTETVFDRNVPSSHLSERDVIEQVDHGNNDINLCIDCPHFSIRNPRHYNVIPPNRNWCF